ncbi:hypothetical protein BDV37DRAFT_251652 [Aspergillus pseudonomiae]|uniref:Uncharacterized protein n=1 Tax=Aspergillus pseudonomiae TaxID=1506151 RepID=A0A5N7D9X3_9EURO|nr:uncharacterized protein BDV37DRAFT_251652 [Aspergillus pseudonomiae]KAE8402803.1 hypothetical protein BDV37DRAFT_251652 [Aspergillus pseudonomiae]
MWHCWLGWPTGQLHWYSANLIANVQDHNEGIPTHSYADSQRMRLPPQKRWIYDWKV